MRIYTLNSRAFSYVEAIIATAILGIAVVGILMTVASIKKPAAKTDRALVAAYYGQEVLEGLRAKVDARDWDSGELAITTTTPHVKTKTIDGVVYKASYHVSEDPETGSRKVDLSVDLPDLE